MDMTNIAYTKEYQAERKKYDSICRQEYLKATATFDISAKYKIEKRDYLNNDRTISVSENRLLDTDGNEIYRYQNIDDSAEFYTLIEHSNGHTYLVFRTDLYGYSVFDLTDKKDFHYIPKEEEAETFIWTDIFYNPENNILIVSGCYWACPSGTLILDFSNPMYETTWVDIHEEIDEGYLKYDDIDFVRWDGEILILKAREVYKSDGRDKSRSIEIAVSKEQYTKWLFDI